MSSKNYILSKETAAKKLNRMAYEIVERNARETELIIAGIKANGIVIANKIAALLKPIFPGKISVIEISLDKKNPFDINIHPQAELNDKIVIIVDDVANTGKTLLYALKPFLLAYPKKIQTLVLVERTHKLFPVKSDYVGLSIGTALQEQIIVEVDKAEVTGAYIIV
ncbi:MAG: phosphoribosyltransferase [Chitinophagaceae bacterium]|nr:phosphoribosyltransferase [Chitinophagaceae bacterium]